MTKTKKSTYTYLADYYKDKYVVTQPKNYDLANDLFKEYHKGNKKFISEQRIVKYINNKLDKSIKDIKEKKTTVDKLMDNGIATDIWTSLYPIMSDDIKDSIPEKLEEEVKRILDYKSSPPSSQETKKSLTYKSKEESNKEEETKDDNEIDDDNETNDSDEVDDGNKSDDNNETNDSDDDSDEEVVLMRPRVKK